MNNYTFLIKSSIADLKRNKGRTFLTSLGILIGVMAVVLLIGFGIGIKNFIKDQFDSLGTNLVNVFPGKIIDDSGNFRDTEGGLGGISFNQKDVANLQKIPEAEFVVPAFVKTTAASAKDKSHLIDLYATTQDIFPTRNLNTTIGNSFNKQDVSKGSKVAVIGPKVAEEIFGSTDSSLGKTIEIDSVRFKIIGILEEKGGGGFGGPNFDSFVYVPHTAAVSLNPNKEFFTLIVKANSEENVPILKEKVKQTLNNDYDEGEFSVIEQTEILNVINQIFTILNSVLIAIGSISLIVGGIGIMNIMYASVTERINEIGIRRAIGATKKDILLQFLVQSTIISLIGGVLGLTLSIIIILAIQPFFPAGINLIAVLLALGISTLIGIFFGVFPARRAANLSPIDAIRYQ